VAFEELALPPDFPAPDILIWFLREVKFKKWVWFSDVKLDELC